MKKKSRRSELIKLSKKIGWQDGRDGRLPNPPIKQVMGYGSNGVRDSISRQSKEETDAHHLAFEEGANADNKERNPYAL